MSQHYKKYSINFSIILAFWAMAVILSGCTDDFIYEPVDIPDAEIEIKGEVIFKPLMPMAVQTRAEAPEGDKYKGIKSLYVFFFDSEGKPVTEYSGDVDFTPVPSEGSTHEHITFKKKVRSGRYYIYAIANLSDAQKSDLTNVTSIEDLRTLPLVWDDNIENDLEMFGVFRQDGAGTVPDNEGFEMDELLAITPNKNSIHSWVRRAVSKVTVDFDGTNLKEGVTVYIKNAVLKDVASDVLLGASSAAGENGITCITSDYSITYGEGEDHNLWPTVTKASKFSPSDIWGTPDGTTFHDDNAKALPCYENMQGTHKDKSKLQDTDGDGIIDSERKDGVDYGTFLEVEGYYVANRPEYKSEGKIFYRFMLGNNATNNFDVVRNHHYKITMNFKDYGNDIDWHIEYGEKYLDVTYPKDVNYQGKFFVPSLDYSATMANAGHDLTDFTQGFHSTNESPTDLWSNAGGKTVYDPCPPGYQVGDKSVFTGFTTHGLSAKFPYDWFDVLESNMQQGYYSTDMSVNKQVLELYTDTRKVQSITFPITGYRDYDGKAEVVKYPRANVEGEYEGYVWFNGANDKTNSYHFKYHRNDIKGTGVDGWKNRGGEGLNLIAPYEHFYNTDGFAVRPVSTKRPEQP